MNLARLLKLKLIGACLILLSFGGVAQNCLAQLLPAPATENQLLARLKTAGEEERLSILADLSVSFRYQPGGLQPATLATLQDILLNDASGLVRTYAAHALEFAATPAASAILISALSTERETATRKAIIYALARYPSPQATTALLPYLTSKQPELRATAAFSLAELADTAAAPALLEFVQKRRKDEDAFARSQAVRGLGRIGYVAAIPLLLQALSTDKAQLVKREAATALGWLTTVKNRAVQTALQQAAMDEDPYLRLAAQQALAKINARIQS